MLYLTRLGEAILEGYKRHSETKRIFEGSATYSETKKPKAIDVGVLTAIQIDGDYYDNVNDLLTDLDLVGQGVKVEFPIDREDYRMSIRRLFEAGAFEVV